MGWLSDNLGSIAGGIGGFLYGGPAGAALGAGLFGGSRGGSQTSTSTQELPEWLKPIAGDFTSRAKQVGDTPFPGVEGFNANQNNAFDMVRNRAMSDPSISGAEGLLGQTMRGDFLNPNSNPFLSPVLDAANQKTMGTLNRTFSGFGGGGGAFGGSAHQEVAADTLGRLNQEAYLGNYNNERSRQQQAISLAPSISGAGYLGAQNLLNIGNQQQQFGQTERDAPFNFGMRQLDAYAKPFGYNMGGTTTQTQPGPSTMQNLLGTGMGIAGIGNLFGLWG